MKTFPLPTLACGFALVITGLYCETASAQGALRWKLQKGDKYELQMKQQTNSVVSLSSRKLTSTVDLQVNVSWDVQSAEDDQFVIEQTIDSIRIEMKGADQNPVKYDSADKAAVPAAAKPLQAAVAPLLGAKFSLSMNALGAISSAKRISPEGTEAVPVGDAGKNAGVSKESIEQLLLQPLLPLPKESLDSDQSWTDERQTKAALGDVKLKRTFTLAGMEDRAGKPAAKIEIKGELTVTPPAGAPKNAPQLKQQSHSGTAWFAKEAGRLVAVETTQRLVTESMYRDSTITVDLTTNLSTTLMPRE
jgi:hypothetical protein